MQFSKISLLSLLVATVSAAATAEEAAARDVKLASPASAHVEKREAIVARAKKGKGSGGGGGGEEEDAASSLNLNIVLAAGAGVVAIGAMML